MFNKEIKKELKDMQFVQRLINKELFGYSEHYETMRQQVEKNSREITLILKYLGVTYSPSKEAFIKTKTNGKRK